MLITVARLRRIIREVMHPAIEKEKAATTAQPAATQGGAGKAQPVAATKISSAKTSATAPAGYRVTDGNGTRKGHATGHDGELTHVKWDDGSESDEVGASLRDLKELRQFIAALLTCV